MTRSQRPVAVRAPATSANLGPGFDALGLALTLHDHAEAQITSGGLAIEVSGEGEATADAGEKHLVVRAMRAAFDRLGGQPPGLALRCRNAIPHGRGLGSSAAAICSGLLLARALAGDAGARLPDQALFGLAAELEGHPDNVAACLAGGLTIAWTPRPAPAPGPGQAESGAGAGTGAGQGAETGTGPAPGARLARVPVLDTVTAVVCVPPFPLATEAARRVLPATVPHADAAANAGRSALLVAALTGAPELLLEATEDFLHQPYRAAVMPASAQLVAALRQARVAAVVSGAGPSVLALMTAAPEGGRQLVDSIAAETGIAWRVIPLDVDRQGATLQPRGLSVRPQDTARRGTSWTLAQEPGAGHAGLSPRGRPASSATH